MSDETYPKSRDDLINLMPIDLQTRITTDVAAISQAIITAATAGQGSVEYCSSQDILEYSLVIIRSRFPDCPVFYTSPCTVKVVWLQ